MKKLVIDADSLIYRACHVCQTADEELEGLEDGSSEDIDLPESDEFKDFHTTFHSMVKEITSDLERQGEEWDDVELVITVKNSSDLCSNMSPNFRYEVMESVEDVNVKGYKANRSGMEVPYGLLELYDYVFQLENSICESAIEADDYCVYMANQGHLVCALDKDVLGSIELGWNYGKKEWIENTREDINRFPFYQTLTGDSSDGLRGAFRIGPKKADAILEGLTEPYDMWKAVVRTYFEKDQTLEEALATMHCVRMDMWTPEKGLVMWEPPKKETK